VIEDVGEQASGVQIDTGVKCVRLVVEAHWVASVATGRPEPASWLPAVRPLAETSTLGPGASPRSRCTLVPGSGPSPWGHEKYPSVAAAPALKAGRGS
jgi:hypothetical protein